jgi:hypothetical protein
MLAMQYSFVLPADYDMDIIRRRIVDKGPMLDDFPGLRFKAYLYADQRGARLPTSHNLYAPLYLWEHNDGMNAFLGSGGFAAATQNFGWPEVKTWSVWHAETSPELRHAVCASRDLAPIPPYAPLDEWREREREAAQQDLAAGALAAVSAFDPTHWTLLRFRLWGELHAELALGQRQLYEVGYVATSTQHAALPA